MLAGLIWRPRLIRLLLLVLIGVAAVMAIFVYGRASIAVCDRSGGGVADIAVSDYYRVMGADLLHSVMRPCLELACRF